MIYTAILFFFNLYAKIVKFCWVKNIPNAKKTLK